VFCVIKSRSNGYLFYLFVTVVGTKTVLRKKRPREEMSVLLACTIDVGTTSSPRWNLRRRLMIDTSPTPSFPFIIAHHINIRRDLVKWIGARIYSALLRIISFSPRRLNNRFYKVGCARWNSFKCSTSASIIQASLSSMAFKSHKIEIIPLSKAENSFSSRSRVESMCC